MTGTGEDEDGKASLFGIEFSRWSTDRVAEVVTGPLSHKGVRTVVTCNLDHLYNLRKNASFRAAYDAAAIRTVDGRPLALYANKVRKLGLPLVAGADLFPRILGRLKPALHRPFFVTSGEATAASLGELLSHAGFSPGHVGVHVPMFGFESRPEVSAELAAMIRAHGTTHLFMGIGSPKSEIWLDKNKGSLGDLHAFGFGAGLDFLAGTKTRAPDWMQRSGLEWFHRLSSEPRRLAPRYAKNAISFAGLVLADIFGGRPGQNPVN